MLYNVQDLVYKLKTYKKQEANFIVFLLFSNLILIKYHSNILQSNLLVLLRILKHEFPKRLGNW